MATGKAAQATGTTPSAEGPTERKSSLVPANGRFYEAEWPEINDVVVVQIVRVTDMGVFAQLLEFNCKRGFIPVELLSARLAVRTMPGISIPNVKKMAPIGGIAVCAVTKLDVRKGNMDLSKCVVKVEEAVAKQADFAKAKVVHMVMRVIASRNGLDTGDLCSKVSWPLFKRHKDVLEVLKRHVMGDIDLWKELDFSQPGKDLSSMACKLQAEITAEVRRRLDQQKLHVLAKFEVACFEYDGIEAVQRALRIGKQASTKECQLRIRLISHPLFSIETASCSRDDGVAVLDAALDLIECSILEAGGHFRLRSHPNYADHELESDSDEDGDWLEEPLLEDDSGIGDADENGDAT